MASFIFAAVLKAGFMNIWSPSIPSPAKFTTNPETFTSPLP